MKKLFKSLSILLIALAAAIACFAIAGCAEQETPPATQADYVIVLQYQNGTKVNGQTGNKTGGKVFTQICLTGAGATCRPLTAKNIYPDENGRLELSQAQVDDILGQSNVTTFVFHALNVKDANQDSSITISQKGTVTLIVDAAQ